MSSRNLNISFTSEIAKETKQVEVGEGLGLEADPYNFLVYGWMSVRRGLDDCGIRIGKCG